MTLAERRRLLGYSQEGLAQRLGVDRTTIGRWESGRSQPQPVLRPRLAELLGLGVVELDAFIVGSSSSNRAPSPARRHSSPPASAERSSRDTEEMIRRDVLRALAVGGAVAVLPAGETIAPPHGALHRPPFAHVRSMNDHLWQVYQHARMKAALTPVVQDQLAVLSTGLQSATPGEARPLVQAAADLFQLAGELAFDADRYADAAACYTLAASAGKESGSFDLWACSLVRHAYLDLNEGRHRQAAEMLTVAEGLARRGDTALPTRHWVASVQAEAHAGLRDLAACERALDRAAGVLDLTSTPHNGGWLRFDGSRLAEERGARYLRLGRLDEAESALTTALAQPALVGGHFFRRRGAIFADLALIAALRRDLDQMLTLGRQALDCARASSSGYLARRLRSLETACDAVPGNASVAELRADIAALSTA